MPIARNFEQIIQLGKETTWATGVAPTVIIPVTGGGGNPQNEEVLDEGRRGIPSRIFAAFQGSGHGQFSIEGFAYPDRFGHILKGIFGGESISGAADPYEHTFTLDPDPPSYTIEEQIVAGADGAMRFVGSRFASIGLNFDSGSGVLNYTSEIMSKLPSKVTKAAVTLGTVVNTWPSWSATISSTGMTNRILTADVTITRELQIVHTGDGSQSPYAIAVGPMHAEGTVTLVTESLSDLDLYLADTQQGLTISWAYTPAGGELKQLDLVMSVVTFAASPMQFNRDAVIVSNQLNFAAIANATDAGAGAAVAPIKAVLTNGQAAAY